MALDETRILSYDPMFKYHPLLTMSQRLLSREPLTGLDKPREYPTTLAGYENILEEMQEATKTATTADKHGCNNTWDLQFPINSQSSLLAKLSGVTREACWLPAGCQLNIKLFKRADWQRFLYDKNYDPNELRKNVEPPDEKKLKEAREKTSYQLFDINLHLESYTPKSSELAHHLTNFVQKKYTVDYPRFEFQVRIMRYSCYYIIYNKNHFLVLTNLQGVSYAQSYWRGHFTLKKTCKAVILFFAHNAELYPDPAKKYFLSTPFFQVPDGLREMHFLINGRRIVQPLLGAGTKTTAHLNTTCQFLVQRMWQQKIYKSPNATSFFPPGKDQGVAQLFCIDMMALGLNEAASLDIDCWFTPSAAKDLSLGMIALETKEVTCTKTSNGQHLWTVADD